MQPAQTFMEAAIIALVAIGWLLIVTGVGRPKDLASGGKENFRYFTVLSNLLVGLVALISLVCLLTGATALPDWLIVLKLLSTTAIMVTFLTTIVLLVSKYGWKSMYSGGSLFYHLLVPIFAVVDCVLFVQVGKLPLWATACGMIPNLLYGVWYLRNVIVHGVEEDGKVYDFYGFLRWGWDKVPLVAVGMFGMAWALALALWFVGKALCLA